MNAAQHRARVEAKRARTKAKRIERAARGACLDCERPREPGKARCTVHRAQARARHVETKIRQARHRGELT